MPRWIPQQAKPGIRAAMALVVCLIAGCGDRTDEALVTEALDESAGVESVEAVRRLAERTTIDRDNPTRAHLRKVFRESDRPAVRVAAIDGIAKGWDYDAMEDLFAALDDPSLEVRERSGRTVQRMIGLKFPYNAQDPPQKRAKVIAHMRQMWDRLRTSDKLGQWLDRLDKGEVQ